MSGIADQSVFPGDSEDRDSAIIATAGTLGNPEDFISDFGDFNSDHTENQHTLSQEHTDDSQPVVTHYIDPSQFDQD
jgi:hypothetical protein